MKWRDMMCGEPRPEHVGRRITLAGWAHRRRDHGGLVFIDLRDHTGICQLVVNPEHAPAAAEVAHGVRNEFVLRAEGELVARAPELVNPNTRDWRGRAARGDARHRLDGACRCRSSSTRRASTRLLRLRYRWLDLRRDTHAAEHPALARRSSPTIRRSMEEQGFIDIWTPV